MLFYKGSTLWKHLKGIGLVAMDATCWVSWGKSINTPYSTASFWRSLSIAYFLSRLLSFEFICLCLLLLLVSPDIDPVLFVLDLHMKYRICTMAWLSVVCKLCTNGLVALCLSVNVRASKISHVLGKH